MKKRISYKRSNIQLLGLFTAPFFALAIYFLLPETYQSSQGQIVQFSHAGKVTAATGVWMAIWWMTEAIPVYATSLLPIALLPATGAASIKQACAPYGHELIFLFMGGFILALSMQRWKLHKRISFFVLRLVGTRPNNIVAGFMGITAVLSMWISNTATAVMMLPIGLSVIDLVLSKDNKSSVETNHTSENDNKQNFSICLMLGIAYSASIGGIGTLIGTPPNLFMASYIKNNLGIEISFVKWMGVGLPLVAVFIPIVWLLMTRVLYPVQNIPIKGGTAFAKSAYQKLGPMTRGEWIAFIVFIMAASLWIFRPLLAKIEWNGLRIFSGLTDTGIAIVAALALFVIPVDIKKQVFAMNWETAVKLPWGLLILFGGGLSLAASIKANGVGELIGNQVHGFSGMHSIFIVMSVSAIIVFLTELSSNTATTATLIPVLAAIASGMGFHPLHLIVPAAISASCAFMLPVATPPNAIVFGAGYVTIPQMCRAGLWLNIIGILLITGLTYAIAIPVLL
jgi:sodium-dependent dicarboxylate transporter 2/3/5